MKYIFPDSNIFYDHWHFSNAEFRLLADSIKNSQSVLLMSEIVCREVQNLYQREQKKVIAELKKNYEKAQKFNKERKEFNVDGLIQPYNFKEQLKEKIVFVEFIEFDVVSNVVVVERAVAQTLPFRDNEKGYRDTMIWLSLLNFLKQKTKDDEVFFISRNKSDFYGSNGQRFHEDLANDLKDYGISCQINVFLTLNEFIKAKVETNEYEFSNSSISEQLDYISKAIEGEVIWIMDIMQSNDFKRILDASGQFFRATATLLNHKFGIDEGIEDGTVISYKRLSSHTLYINYRFNLRRCSIELTIPAIDFILHKFGKRFAK